MAAGATYEPIATTTLGSAAASITFSSIAGTYTDLVLVVANVPVSSNRFTVTVNGDTATNYSETRLYGDGTSASSVSFAGTSQIILSNSGAYGISMTRINFFNYAGSTYKTALSETAADANGSGTVYRSVGLWRNTAAITSMTMTALTSNFNTGTTATLYGIKAA